MNKIDPTKAFITYILRNNLAREAIDRKVSSDYFPKNSEELKIWQYIVDFYKKYNTTPTVDATRLVFPDFKEIVADIPFDSLINTLWSNQHREEIISCMKEVRRHIVENNDVEKADLEITKFAAIISNAAKNSNDVSWTDTVHERIEDYENIAGKHGVTGIPCYHKKLLEITGGYQTGDYWLIVARPNTGKSWYEVIQAWFTHELGYRVLLFSKEMRAKAIMKRLDALKAKVSYYKLRKGILSAYEKTQYLNAMEDLSAAQNKLIIISDDEGAGISGIDAKIHKYTPDIVFVDAVYLMKDDLGEKDTTKRLNNISQGLKALANKTGVPIVATAQLNRTADKESTGGRSDMSNIFGSDGFGQAPDVILSLSSNEEMLRSNPQKLKVDMIKYREASGDCQYHTYINWDMEKMEFQELTEEEHDVWNPKVKPALDSSDMF